MRSFGPAANVNGRLNHWHKDWNTKVRLLHSFEVLFSVERLQSQKPSSQAISENWEKILAAADCPKCIF